MLLSAGTLSCGSVAPKYQVQVLADKPLVYWRLDEATGTVALDSSGNGLSGAVDLGLGRVRDTGRHHRAAPERVCQVARLHPDLG